ncbi:hypothetical protein NBRC116494_16660 [Aurantivibrio plasticivorans]
MVNLNATAFGGEMRKEKSKLLYILSPSYSGSTLLTMLLAQHAEIATIGELKATSRGDLDNYLCSCGAAMKSCSFWREIESRAGRDDIAFTVEDFGTHFKAPDRWWGRILSAQLRGRVFESLRALLIKVIPGLHREWMKILERNRYLIDQVLQLQSSNIFLDGSKDPNRLLYFVQSGHWDVYVIYMIRDGRAQAHSTRRKERHGMTYAQASKDWRYTVQQMNEVVKYLPGDRLHKLRYEDLCGDPNAIMNDIWAWMGVNPLDQDWTDVDLKQSEHHILGNNMRTKERIAIRYDDSWQTEIEAHEFDTFEKIAGFENKSFGYNKQQ